VEIYSVLAERIGETLSGESAPFSISVIGSDLDAATKARLDRGQRIVELFKQVQYNPIPVEEQVAIMWAMQNGYIDPVPVDRVKEFQTRLQDYLQTRKEGLLRGIREKKQLDQELESQLKDALEDFKATWQ